MDLDRSRGAIRKQNEYEARTVIRNDEEEDLLFDMEDDEFCRQRSKSIDSFCNKNPVESRESPDGESSRESSVGHRPDRPETLRIAGVNRLRREEFYGSLPQSREQDIPSINFQFSVPAHNDLTWKDESSYQTRRGYSSSVSSVEEATEENLTPANYQTRRRPSNNLDISDPQLLSKSQRFLPKFLRASFSKLVSKGKTPVDTPLNMSPSLSRVNSLDSINKYDMESNDADDDSQECSPTTRKFVQDSLAKGLPIIPFNYSTAEIVEKIQQRKRNKNLFQTSSNSALEDRPDMKNFNRTKNASHRRQDLNDEPHLRLSAETHSMKMEGRSLESVLCLAKKEMEEEAHERKISDITGYASNNSRALQRRRSSPTEYVGMENFAHEILKIGSFDRSLVKLRSSKSKFSKSISQQENLSEKQIKLTYDDHNHSDEQAADVIVMQRSAAVRAPSIGLYLDMDCGLNVVRN